MAYKQISPQAVAEGGTGATTLTDHGMLVGSGTSAITALSVGSNGQVPIGSTGADPAFATISSSDSLLTLTAGANTLDIVAQNAVSASSTLTDNLVVRGDGGTRGTQTSTVSITDNGEMTNSSQPAFFAYLGSTDSNETGDGTTFYLGDTDVGTALTEVFDQNSDFTTGASGGAYFTAPVSGKYYLEAAILGLGGGGSNFAAGQIVIDTSNRLIRANVVGGSVNTSYQFEESVITDMDSGDTAKASISLTDPAGKVIDIFGDGTNNLTRFCGSLIC